MLQSFHCPSPKKMSFKKMDPSCTIGFYCRTVQDFEKASEEITKVGVGAAALSPTARVLRAGKAENQLGRTKQESFFSRYLLLLSQSERSRLVFIPSVFTGTWSWGWWASVLPGGAARWRYWSENIAELPRAPRRLPKGTEIPREEFFLNGSIWSGQNCLLFLVSLSAVSDCIEM